MIVKLHGTSGSGKSTVARGLMGKATAPVQTILNIRGKPEAYRVPIAELNYDLYILGPYVSACGGFDGIQDSADRIRLIQQAAAYGHVFYESLLGSEYYGQVGSASEPYGDDHIFAFLDTPIDTCIERVKARRLAAGNTKPLNEENTRGRVKKIERFKHKLHHELGRKVVVIDHTKAVEQVYNLYRGINGYHRT